MLSARYISHPLIFYHPAGTSRGTLRSKPCWYLFLQDEDGITGTGEVSFIPGLSVERPDGFEQRLQELCSRISAGDVDPDDPLPEMPGVQFALETALIDLDNGGSRMLYASAFTSGEKGIPTNGLIWMGERKFMKDQIRKKLEAGFRVLKMKVGALLFEEELELIDIIRKEYSPPDLELRLDANGAWEPEEALEKLKQLSDYHIHSLEQPIAAGRIEAMARVCTKSPVDIALDEELIGISNPDRMEQILDTVEPAYIILKPGLLGGTGNAAKWIGLAGDRGIGWWITSALESNIGLNAIAQWTASLKVSMPQGLGTGSLYSNNIPSPLEMEGDRLWFRPGKSWDLSVLARGEMR